MAHSGGVPRDRPEQPQRCLISVQVEIVAQLAGVYDLEVFVERAVLPKHEFSEGAELVERNDVGDFSGLGGVGIDPPVASVRRVYVRSFERTMRRQAAISF